MIYQKKRPVRFGQTGKGYSYGNSIQCEEIIIQQVSFHRNFPFMYGITEDKTIVMELIGSSQLYFTFFTKIKNISL